MIVCHCASESCRLYGCQKVKMVNIPGNFVGYSHPATNSQPFVQPKIPTSGKKPYKCPVCDGSGKHYIDPNKPLSGFEALSSTKDANGLSYNLCNSCEGKGIVWG